MSGPGEGAADLKFPSPPHVVTAALRWTLLTNYGVVFGSAFVGLGIIFALALGTNTGLWSTLRLWWHAEQAPGWLRGVGETNYEEQDKRVYRYDYNFLLPDGRRERGASYGHGLEQRPVGGVNPAAANITVEYCPGNPRISRIQGTRTGICSPWVLFVWFGPAIGLLATWGGIAHGCGRLRLLERGCLAWATFTAARQVDTDEVDYSDWLGREDKEPAPAKAIGADDAPARVETDERAPMRKPDVQDGAPARVEADDEWTTTELERHRARRLAVRFWIGGVAAFFVFTAILRAAQANAPLPVPWGIIIVLEIAAVSVMAWITYWTYANFGPLIRRRAQLARDGGTIDEFQQAQLEEYETFQRTGQPLRRFGMGMLAFFALFTSVWVGSVFGLIALFVAFIIQRQRGVPLPANFQGPEVFIGGAVWVIAAALTLRALRRWANRREEAQAVGLIPARQTDVECTFEFRLPDGRVITAKDQYPLPMARSDVRPQIVLYDPKQPESCVRLFAVAPAVWITERGEWRADLRGGWALVRLTFAAVCYTAGPLLGWLAMRSIDAP